jgi:hypothetical protein
LFFSTGYDFRESAITLDKASILIGRLKNGERFDPAEVPDAIFKRQVAVKLDYQAIHDEAMKAGHESMSKCVPTPMVVQQHANPLNDNSPVVQSWVVPGGVCGFTSIVVKPANCGFAQWAKHQGIGHPSDYQWHRGMHLHVEPLTTGQSLELKEAFCQGYQTVLDKYGIKNWLWSRMD